MGAIRASCVAHGIGFLRLSVLVLLLAASVSHAQTTDRVAERRVALPGHTVARAGQAPEPVLPNAVGGEIEITIVLRRNDEAGFARHLAALYDPASPEFRQFLSPTAVSDRFGPSADDYAAVRDYLTQAGLRVVADSPNRMTIGVRGSRDAIQQTFAVTINDHVTKARVHHAAENEPSLPASVAMRVQAISGLTSMAPPRPLGDEIRRALCIVQAKLQGGYTQPCDSWHFPAPPPPPGPPPPPDTDYDDPPDSSGGGFAALAKRACPVGGCLHAQAASPNGAGQKVGLLEFDTFHQSDVVDFFTLFPTFGNLAANVGQVHVNGGASLGAGEREVLLDIVTVLSLARGTSVVVYDAPPTTSYQALFNAMINDGVTIISNSWSSCEDQVPLADIMSIDAIFQTAAASGISVFNGSGDSGTTCLDGSPNTIGVPADSPNATAVGGTSLKPALGYLYGTETWWDGTAKTPPTGQGGYGVSRFFPRPAYQSAVSPAAMRSVPDVSVNADPRWGAILCQADDGGCPTGKLYGGTSMAAPVWAAFAARLNQMLGHNIGAMNPILYPLAGTEAFHTPASMGSDFAHVGLGSPNLNRLGAALLGVSAGQVDASRSSAYYASTVLGTMEVAPLATVPADGSTAAVVVVRLLDAQGLTVSGKQVQLSMNAGSHAVVSPASATTSVANGAAAFSVTDLFAETVTFTATDTSDGVVIVNTATVTFDVPSAASAGIVASPTPVPSDGTSPTTITVTLKDSLNRPTPGKLITLAQGNGHSIISGSNPLVTDANGQIQFTATDNFAEVVTYTAVDVTDGDLPVPGSAPVTFTGGTTSCVTSPPTPAAGFTLTPFASGFAAQVFFFSNVNWGGCPGASNPAFDTTGNVFVSDFFTGALSKLGLSGGAVSSGNTLATIGQTLQQPAFGKDGSLYVARAATGSGFNSGTVSRIDASTGAVLQTLVTGLTCPSPLAVDPLSGDLFFTGTCFGAGSDDPRVWRIQNPASASPTLVVYATLPSTPNGPIAFAPNGTMYVVSNYTGTGSVIQIAGTDKPSPAMTTLAGISSDFWITMGEVLPNGSAKSLLVHNNNALKLVDITTNPFTAAVLVNGGIGSGTIGPDGCLYATASDRVLKLAPTSGACGFVPSNPSPSLVLAPSTVSPNPSQGTSQTFTATFRNTTVPPGTPVFFQITGVNAQTKLGTTDANGAASVSYTGISAGSDKVVASSSVGNSSFTSNPALLTWGSGRHATFLTLNLSPTDGAPGQPVTVVASLADISAAPIVPIAGATISFSLGNQTCGGVTGVQGTASCTLLIPPGAVTLTASFAGNGQNASAVDSEQFRLVAPAQAPPPPPPPPTSAPAPIPTLSAWGLSIIALMLAAAGTVATRRRR